MMDSFKLKVAGLVAHVHPLYLSTKEYLRSYLTDENPDIHIHVSNEDLQHEQKMLELEAIEEGLKIRKFTNPFLERTVIQRCMATELLNRNTILLHGSTIAVEDKAYLFTAPCGTGKSTHTRLWREVFGDRAVMVNDDKAFLKITESEALAYGSPWSGKHGLDTNVCVPLKGICFLRRGTCNEIIPASAENWIPELRHQCFVPEDHCGAEMVDSLIQSMTKTVTLWEMSCTKDPEAAYVAYQAMSSK